MSAYIRDSCTLYFISLICGLIYKNGYKEMGFSPFCKTFDGCYKKHGNKLFENEL